jgi:hypothetical protein
MGGGERGDGVRRVHARVVQQHARHHLQTSTKTDVLILDFTSNASANLRIAYCSMVALLSPYSRSCFAISISAAPAPATKRLSCCFFSFLLVLFLSLFDLGKGLVRVNSVGDSTIKVFQHIVSGSSQHKRAELRLVVGVKRRLLENGHFFFFFFFFFF